MFSLKSIPVRKYEFENPETGKVLHVHSPKLEALQIFTVIFSNTASEPKDMAGGSPFLSQRKARRQWRTMRGVACSMCTRWTYSRFGRCCMMRLFLRRHKQKRAGSGCTTHGE